VIDCANDFHCHFGREDFTLGPFPDRRRAPELTLYVVDESVFGEGCEQCGAVVVIGCLDVGGDRSG